MAAGDVGMVVVAPAASFHHTHHHHHHHDAAASTDPIFPLLSAGPCALDPDAAKAAAASSGIQFWQSSQQHQQQPPQSPSSGAAGGGGNNPNPSLGAFYLPKKPLPMLDTGGGGSSGSGTTTCQDCGNQAKKDCSHSRCRTCCKSRGFDCSTHVKSTWVPAARRRERQHLGGSESSPATASTPTGSKKPRLLSSQAATSHTSTSNATTPRSYDTTSSHQDPSFRGSLPRQVRAPAVFRCVRVTSVDDGEDEYAYQATVTINGHVFKGFLYDQGPNDGRANNDIDSTAGVPSMSDLHLGGANAARGAGASSSMAPSDMYGGGGAGQHILGGSGYGNTMN